MTSAQVTPTPRTATRTRGSVVYAMNTLKTYHQTAVAAPQATTHADTPIRRCRTRYHPNRHSSQRGMTNVVKITAWITVTCQIQWPWRPIRYCSATAWPYGDLHSSASTAIMAKYAAAQASQRRKSRGWRTTARSLTAPRTATTQNIGKTKLNAAGLTKTNSTVPSAAALAVQTDARVRSQRTRAKTRRPKKANAWS